MNKISDLETQKKILAEDKKIEKLNKRYKKQVTCLILFIVLIMGYSYLRIYTYSDNGLNINAHCQNANKEDPYHVYEMINISEDASCKVIYNVDYHGNGRVLFNIDIYGNKKELFNKINQKDKSGNCIINCDSDDDGFPDYNIDLNGDGIIDLNKNGKDKCNDDCDKNFDMVVDSSKVKLKKEIIKYLNYDINYDGICDINCDTDKNYEPDKNIDTDNDLLPDKAIDYNNDGVCDLYCEEALNIKDEQIKQVIIDDNNNNGYIDVDLSEVNQEGQVILNMVVKNKRKHAIKYDIDWKNIQTDYTETNNLNYIIDRNNEPFVEIESLPFEDTTIKSDILSPSSSVKYTLKITTNYYLSSTKFSGKLFINIK